MTFGTISTQIKNRVIHFGHTPDPDDAFMFYGFATNQVRIPGFQINHVLEDIETLNQKALGQEIDVTAISAAMYPHLYANYWILPMGASVGRNYGPIVAQKKGNRPKGRTIGIPGFHTTSYLLLQLYTDGYEAKVYRFDDIPGALQKGEVDYGLLIHEAQLTFDSLGLEKIMDLGVAWSKDTHLPIPLGLDVIRKNMGKELAWEIAIAFRKSIECALAQRADAIRYAQQFGRGLEGNLTDRFVGMYVNQDTLNLGEEGERALSVLFDKAYRAGIYKSPTIVDVLKP